MTEPRSAPAVEVCVWQPVAYDHDLVAAALGEPPLVLPEQDRVLAPFITANGRVHAPTSNFLRHHCMARPDLATARRIASDLKGWLAYLINQRHLHPHEDGRDPVFAATEEDLAAYYRLRQYGPADQQLTPDAWRNAASAIKRLYEHLQHQYQHTPPFEIITVSRRGHWTGTTITKYRPRRRKTGSAGTPLTPEFAQLLLMGALRVDLTGQQQAYRGADRDHALLALGLATGLRHNNLAHVTVYELPRPTPRPLSVMRVADSITKLGAGGDTLVFTHYLPAIWGYIDGARAELTTRRPYRPADPLHIVDADAVSVRYEDPTRPGKVHTRRWTDCDEQFRRRLVDTDGSTPIVFLNELTAQPFVYRSLQHSIEGARQFAREHLNPNFPAHVRLHDLRHTYAVHLTIAIYRDALAAVLPEDRRDDWRVDRISGAVELVKSCLGHASEASTRLYIQTAHRFLDIPLNQFLGEP